jgi:hypothetical protein
MRYSIGDSVYIVKTGEFKKIVDCEFICNVELYYMSDYTAYPIESLTKVKPISSQEELSELISKNKDVIINLIDYDKIGKKWADNFRLHYLK